MTDISTLSFNDRTDPAMDQSLHCLLHRLVDYGFCASMSMSTGIDLRKREQGEEQTTRTGT